MATKRDIWLKLWLSDLSISLPDWLGLMILSTSLSLPLTLSILSLNPSFLYVFFYMLIEDLCMWPGRPVTYWVFQDVSREQPSETRSDHSGSFILSSTFKSLRGPTEDEEPRKFELIRRCNLIDFGVFHISLGKVWRGAFITGTLANFLSPTSLLLLSLNHKSVSNVGATVPCWRLQLPEKLLKD